MGEPSFQRKSEFRVLNKIKFQLAREQRTWDFRYSIVQPRSWTKIDHTADLWRLALIQGNGQVTKPTNAAILGFRFVPQHAVWNVHMEGSSHPYGAVDADLA
ncbi:MAG TPA: hypothetical protein DCZ69_13520, partial [Syntrophobacteraceae bacterium]|nr:hypothetical protein [Syntrophobacteraceae bacterium]